ncbi:MAG: hypothetical protein KDA22_14945 [Phycisphaerales bacterium]|nr:hypothetical protein [Phycisphaerales bacterium]
MAGRTWGVGVLVAALATHWSAPPCGSAQPAGAECVLPDAESFWERLVSRYRAIDRYEDEVEVEEIVELAEGSTRYQSKMLCSFDGDRVEVVTPGSQLLGLVRLPCPAKGARLERTLWTAPHLALRCASDPLAALHAPACGTFMVASIEQAAQDGVLLARLRLESGDAVFELTVDVQRMLVVELEATHRLDEGGVMRLRHLIHPKRVREHPVSRT